MLKSARALVTLLVLAGLAGSAVPLCRCLSTPAAAPGTAEGHECCAPQTTAALRAAACCPVAPAALASTATAPPEPPSALAGALPVAGLQPVASVVRAAAFVAPSPPAPARSSSILRV